MTTAFILLTLATTFDLPDIVAWKPAGFSVEGTLPPSPILGASYVDDVTLGEGELILIVLLEVEASFYHQLRVTVLCHILNRDTYIHYNHTEH